MFDRSSLKEGMEVRTRDGDKLGKIVRCGENDFEIEKGFFFPKEYLAQYDDVADVRDGAAFLAISSDELKRMQEGSGGERSHASSGERWAGSGAPAAGFGAGQALTGEREAGRVEASGEVRASGMEGTTRAGATEEVRVPIAEEELEARKRDRETGRVTVSKEIETEEREIKVPVRKERVHVERGPAERRAAGDGAFEERTFSVPVHEEEVEIRKHPVVKDEVRISKSAEEEEREISEDVRKERADVRTEGDVGPERGDPDR